MTSIVKRVVVGGAIGVASASLVFLAGLGAFTVVFVAMSDMEN